MREYQRIVAQQQTKEIWAVLLSIVAMTLCVGVVLAVYTRFRSTSGEEPVSTVTIVAASGDATIAPALTPTSPLPIIASTDTPVPTASSTVAPSPSPTTVLSPTTSSSPGVSSADAQDDVMTYDTGDPVAEIPAGVDIEAASVDADLRVTLQPTDGAPSELAGWANEGEALLWISIYDPIPDPPAAFTDWVFVLDVDGDQGTGRPSGTVRVNPDLGYEVAIGVSYNQASGNYEPYFLVWDAAQLGLVSAGNAPRFIVNDSRTLIGLALPLASLTESVAQTAGVNLVSRAIRGRVAAQSVVGGRKVIDVYPALPD